MNKHGMNLVELAQEIMRRANTKRDFVAVTSGLVFENNWSCKFSFDEILIYTNIESL